jgi:hypothetical protein
MNIPQKADKWIVFVATLVLAMVGDVRHPGFAGDPFLWCVGSVLIAVLLTLIYVIWCAFCRWLARRLRTDSLSKRVRFVSNTIFFALLILGVFLPVRKVTVGLPAPVNHTTPPDRVPDTRSSQSEN